MQQSPNNPVQISDDMTQVHATGIFGSGQPRHGHHDSEEAVLPRNIQFIPVLGGVVAGERPCVSGPPIWLTSAPPINPRDMELFIVLD